MLDVAYRTSPRVGEHDSGDVPHFRLRILQVDVEQDALADVVDIMSELE